MTEIDVPIPSGQWNPATQYQQAAIFKGLLGVCAENPICKSFETWGFTDKYTDIGSWQYPLPFDQVWVFFWDSNYREANLPIEL